MVNMDKNPANLVGQDGRAPDVVNATYQWRVEQTAAKGFARIAAKVAPTKIDVDTFLIAFNREKKAVAAAHPNNPDALGDGTMVYTGDAVAKAGGEAQESIQINLANIDQEVKWLAFGIVAPTAAAYGKLALSRVMVANQETGEMLVSKLRSIETSARAALLVSFQRSQNNTWKISEITGGYNLDADQWRNIADAARSEVCI
jgi:stress response protein SCP2